MESVIDTVDELVDKADRALMSLRLLKSSSTSGQPGLVIATSTRSHTIATWNGVSPCLNLNKSGTSPTAERPPDYQATFRASKPPSVLRKSESQRGRSMHPTHSRRQYLRPDTAPLQAPPPPVRVRSAYRILDEKFNPKERVSVPNRGPGTEIQTGPFASLVSKPLPPTPPSPAQNPRGRENSSAKLTRPPRVSPRNKCSTSIPRRAETAPSSWTRKSERRVATTKVRFDTPPASPTTSLSNNRTVRARLTKPGPRLSREPIPRPQSAPPKSGSFEKRERWIPPAPDSSKPPAPTPKPATRRYSLIEVSKSPPLTIVQLPRSVTPPPPPPPKLRVPRSAGQVGNSPGFRGVNLRADDIRPDLEKCDVLVIAIAEMEICKEIFVGWKSQLVVAEVDPRRSDKLEAAIIASVEKLTFGATAALQSSHAILRLYQSITRTMERRLDEISQQDRFGRSLLLSPKIASELKNHSTALEAHSRALTGHVQRMQALLRELVQDLEQTKEGAMRRALRRKIWLWIARVFRTLSVVLSAGGTILAFVYPIGFLETTAIAGASMFSGAISKLCDIAHEKYTETKLDAILAFLRNSVPESAQAAFLALTSFQACHRVLRLEIEVREGKRHSPWVETREAAVAKTEWARAGDRLGVVERRLKKEESVRS